MINGASKLGKDVKVDYLVILLFCLSHIFLKSQKRRNNKQQTVKAIIIM